MGKRRNTAKTGDKKIYKAREQQASSLSAAHRKRNDSDDDAMYSKVDRFHNEREFIHLNADDGNNTNNKSDSDSDEEQVEAVMDLGVGGDESSSDDDDDDDDSSEASEALSDDDDDDDAEKALSSDSDDDDDDDDLAANVRDWGKKKSAYYHGDTADLEIGQEEDDAFLEEKAAEEIQAARYEEMSEDDFVISDTENDKPEAMDATAQATTTTTTTALSSTRDLSKLSGKDRQKILDKQHPEMLPLLSYFSGVVKELDEKTRIATNVLFEGEEGSAEVSSLVLFHPDPHP